MLPPAMIRETVSPLGPQVQRWREVFGCSQNAFARRAGVHPSILSRLLTGEVVAGPSERKLRGYLARLEQAKRPELVKAS